MYKKNFNLRNVVAIATCLAAMTMFSGCNPDEDEPGKSDSVVGVWVLENSAINVEIADTVPQETANDIKKDISNYLDEELNGTNWDFRNEGKIIITFPDGEELGELSYTVESNKLIVTSPYSEFENMTGQYSISGSKLYWDINALDSYESEELTAAGVTKAIVNATFNKK